MSDPDFRAVLESLSTGVKPTVTNPAPARVVAVLGAGPVGRLLACEALAAGAEVRLQSVFARELDELRTAGAITVRGAHLVGSYSVSDSPVSRPHIHLVASVDRAVAAADVVFIATPASAHATHAELLAGCVRPGQVVVLVPGRFLGSVVVRDALARHHADDGVTVAELGNAPYIVTAEKACLDVHGVARQVDLAALPVEAAPTVAGQLAAVLPMLQPVDSPLTTTFGAVTGVVAVAPRLTNTALVEANAGKAVLLKELLPPGLSQSLLRSLDEERREVAFHYGVRELPSAARWLDTAYGRDEERRNGDDLATVIGDLEVFDTVTLSAGGGPGIVDDVCNLLVPTAQSGQLAGVPTPATDAVVALASVLIGADLASAGRSLHAVGLGEVRPADARRTLARVAELPRPASIYWSV